MSAQTDMHNIASATGKVVLQRARVQLISARQTQTQTRNRVDEQRLPLRWALENLDLNPSQLPPNGVLLIKHLRQSVRPQAGHEPARTGAPDWLDSQQQARLRNSLADLLGRAVRPQQGRFFGPAPEVVLFQDFSELLASFAIANHEGRVSGQWWWSQVLDLGDSGMQSGHGQASVKNWSAWAETLMQHPEQISAVLVQLLLWRSSEVLVSALQAIRPEQLAGIHHQQLRRVNAAWSATLPAPLTAPLRRAQRNSKAPGSRQQQGEITRSSVGDASVGDSHAQEPESSRSALRIPESVRSELLKLKDGLGERAGGDQSGEDWAGEDRVGPVLVAALVQFQASVLQDQAWQEQWLRIGSRALLQQDHVGPTADEEKGAETSSRDWAKRDAHPDQGAVADPGFSASKPAGADSQIRAVESATDLVTEQDEDSDKGSTDARTTGLASEQAMSSHENGPTEEVSDLPGLTPERGAGRAFLISPSVQPGGSDKGTPGQTNPDFPGRHDQQDESLYREAGQPSLERRVEPKSALLADMDLVTDLGGLFYLIRGFQMPLFDMDEALAMPGYTGSPCASWSYWARLDWLARGLLGQCEQQDGGQLPETWRCDPVWRLLAWLDGREDLDSPPPEMDAAVDAGLWDECWQGWLTQTRRALSRRLREEDSDRRALCDLLQVPARVQATRTHVDVHISLERISMAARVSGLDQDPGWYPEFARIIQFHFDSAGA